MKETILNFLKKESTIRALTSIACILIGLLFGIIMFLCIDSSIAFKNFGILISGGLSNSNSITFYRILNGIVRQGAPLICTGLCVLFAYKTGLFNIGVAGQYTMGVLGSMIATFVFKTPWYISILIAMVFAAIWATIPGLLKVYCHVNEVISGIMLNWIGLFFTNWSFNTYLLDKCINVNLGNKTKPIIAPHLIPEIKLGPGTRDNLSISIFIAIAVAILIYIIIEKTSLGYQLKASGLNKDATKYAGMNDKKNIVLTMTIAGALAGLGASLYYLSNYESWQSSMSESLPAVPWNGIVVAFVAQLNPLGAIIVGVFLSLLTNGAKSIIEQSILPCEFSDLITGVIVYLSGLVAFVITIVNRIKTKKATENVNMESADSEESVVEEGGIENA